jgi:hypothetical protein
MQHLPVMCPTARALAIGWKTSSRHPLYEVHYDGRIRNARTGRILVPSQAKSGRYLKVNLGRALQVMVHQLVAETWHGPAPLGMPQVVDHIDNHGHRCCATNLRWLTRSMNTRQWHAIQAKYQAAGEQYGWTREEVYPEMEWAAHADRLAQAGL